MCCAPQGERGHVGPATPHGTPASRGGQHGGPLLQPGSPGIPQPMLASSVLCCVVRGRAGSTLLRNGQLSRLAGEKKIISLRYFSLYSVPAWSVSAGI